MTLRHGDVKFAEAIGYTLMLYKTTANDPQSMPGFLQVIHKAKSACQRSDHPVEDHFGDVTKMIALGKGGTRAIADFTLSRYACYLIVQDSRKQGTEAKPKILDHMGSTELAANLFRATQTEEKLRRDEISSRQQANQTHFNVGSKVRQTIQELGGTMPESLPAPSSGVKRLASRIGKLIEWSSGD